jgi:hypothetical protein
VASRLLELKSFFLARLLALFLVCLFVMVVECRGEKKIKKPIKLEKKIKKNEL